MPAAQRETGKVQWFDPGIGYGFIKRATGDDLFVHYSEIVSPEEQRRQLVPGVAVEFSVGTDKSNRPCAEGVTILSEGAVQ